MRKLRNFTIGTQLNFLALFPTFVALLAATLILAQSTKNQFEFSLRHELGSLTAVIAQAAEASLLFNDSGSAQRFLDALSAKKNIIYASVTSRDGSMLAEYRRHHEAMTFPLPTSEEMSCNGDYCAATRNVLNAGEALGRVSVVSDLSGLTAQGRENSRALLIAVLIGFLIALPIVSLLKRFIASPLLKIAQFVSKVSSGNTYSLRLPLFTRGKSRNEIAIVVDGLNEMLDCIERRDSELVQARELAQQASRAKSDFVANTSHEIRTPINNIIGFTEILAETIHKPDERRYVDLIKYSADSLLSVINDILDLSKIEAGRMELAPTENDLVAHLKRTCAPLEEFASSKGLRMTCRFDPSFPESVFIDSDRFGQVVVNLVNNAIKFTNAPGSVTVTLQVLSLEPEHVQFSFSVSDTGIGIPPEAQSKIFEAFQQADASTTRRYGGTGLGLSISRSIVHLMGGILSLESSVGKGTTFTMTITTPLRSSSPSVAHSSAANQPNFGEVTEDYPLARVLVVEDNPLSREIAVHRLQKSNFDVTVATNGLEAVQLYSENHFDLVLMDCQMPGMDGFDATRKIREIETRRKGRTLIVALTAHAMAGYRDVCIQAGMDQYITKPITEQALLELITKFSSAAQRLEA